MWNLRQVFLIQITLATVSDMITLRNKTFSPQSDQIIDVNSLMPQ